MHVKSRISNTISIRMRSWMYVRLSSCVRRSIRTVRSAWKVVRRSIWTFCGPGRAAEGTWSEVAAAWLGNGNIILDNQYSYFFPKQALTVGVLADLRASRRNSSALGEKAAQNVARTIGFTSFSKKETLWLQCGGPPMHAAAATATSISRNLIKPTKYWYFLSSKSRFPYKMNGKSTFWLPEVFPKRNIWHWDRNSKFAVFELFTNAVVL